MNQNQSNQLTTILLLVAIVVGAVFYVLPTREKIDVLTVEREEATEDMLELQTEFDQLNAVAQEVSKSEATRTMLTNAVPAELAQDDLIMEMMEIAEGAGFEARVMSFSLRNDQDFGKALGLSMSLVGDYEKLISFMQSLESAKRLIQVESISVQLTSSDEIAFSVNLEAYYQ